MSPRTIYRRLKHFQCNCQNSTISKVLKGEKGGELEEFQINGHWAPRNGSLMMDSQTSATRRKSPNRSQATGLVMS